MLRTLCRRGFHTSRRHFTAPFSDFQDHDPEFTNIAILGGGITGLTSAYFCALQYPTAKITLYEASKRFGGWIKSTKHKTANGEVIFEHGPRSLRPDRTALALISALGLEDQLLVTSKQTPAATKRYVWYDDRLVNVQATWGDRLREPMLRPIFQELWETRNKISTFEGAPKDESVQDFFRRRGCNHLVDDMVSALLHGIYAGDVSKLSMRSVFPFVTYHEEKFGTPWNWLRYYWACKVAFHSPWRLKERGLAEVRPLFTEPILSKQSEWTQRAMSSSIYTLKNGLQTFVTALVENLKANPNVSLNTSTYVDKMSVGRGRREELQLSIKGTDPQASKPKTVTYDRVISTIPSPSLGKICLPLKDVFAESPAATVAVVNLFYDKPDLLPIQGFGFLMPRSVPVQKNPEGALGVVFDTDATPELDQAPGTKLTVMLGGPFWSDYPESQLPSTEETIELAKSVVQAHLGISDEPVLTHAELHKSCIPQYHVGHQKRMIEARDIIEEGGGWSKLRVAGSWYNGIGVNACISSAFETSCLLSEESVFGNDEACQPRVWEEPKFELPFSRRSTR